MPAANHSTTYPTEVVVPMIEAAFNADRRNAEPLYDTVLAEELLATAALQAECMADNLDEPLPTAREVARRVAVALSSIYYGEVR